MASALRPKWAVLSRLKPYLIQHKAGIVLGFLCAILTNALLAANPWVIRYAFNNLGESVTRQKLAYYAGILIVLTLAEGVFRFWTRWILIRISREIEYSLRNDLFAHLERLPMAFYHRNKTGDLMSRATNDLSNVRMLVGPGIMYTANTVLTAIFSIALMLRIDWRLTLVSLIPLPLVSYSVRYYGKRIHDLTEESQAKLADLSARVQESMAGIRVVKAFVQEDYEIDEFDKMNRSLIAKNRELIRVTSIFYPVMQLFIGFAVAVVLWFGGRQVISSRISIGDFISFTVYLGMLAWPMIAFGWVVNLLERGRASMERMNHIFDAPPEIRDSETVDGDFEVRGEIELRNLSSSYNGVPVLRNVSLRIASGKTVAIVGATGSGKTSLVQLIPRLYNSAPNTLFIDGVPVERIPLDKLRRSIGFIPQDTFLFGETIRENIAFGVNAATDAEVRRASEISNILPDVEGFPNQFATVVGERGITLSGGQKQRTAISRAVIRDPKILILDDALSSVDTYTEEQILGQLKHVMRGRTSILISHRVSTVKEADEIIVLDRGAIVERGSHDELLSRHGYYAELHQKQLLEEELSAL